MNTKKKTQKKKNAAFVRNHVAAQKLGEKKGEKKIVEPREFVREKLVNLCGQSRQSVLDTVPSICSRSQKKNVFFVHRDTEFVGTKKKQLGRFGFRKRKKKKECL